MLPGDTGKSRRIMRETGCSAAIGRCGSELPPTPAHRSPSDVRTNASGQPVPVPFINADGHAQAIIERDVAMVIVDSDVRGGRPDWGGIVPPRGVDVIGAQGVSARFVGWVARTMPAPSATKQVVLGAEPGTGIPDAASAAPKSPYQTRIARRCQRDTVRALFPRGGLP
jgi:hypothetical protein